MYATVSIPEALFVPHSEASGVQSGASGRLTLHFAFHNDQSSRSTAFFDDCDAEQQAGCKTAPNLH